MCGLLLLLWSVIPPHSVCVCVCACSGETEESVCVCVCVSLSFLWSLRDHGTCQEWMNLRLKGLVGEKKEKKAERVKGKLVSLLAIYSNAVCSLYVVCVNGSPFLICD